MTELQPQDISLKAEQVKTANSSLRFIGWVLLLVVTPIVCTLIGITIFILLCLNQPFQEPLSSIPPERITPFEAWQDLAIQGIVFSNFFLIPLFFVVCPLVLFLTRRLSKRFRSIIRATIFSILGAILSGFVYVLGSGYDIIAGGIEKAFPAIFAPPIGAFCGFIGHLIIAKFGSEFDINPKQFQQEQTT